ncbi:MAG: ATP-dependent DNA helicase, partial [Vicinamibacteria bacterium]|nr:ATP-dependent DNA helicase [Vicinamibacteria bacterium]
LLAQALGRPISAVLMKGRANYLCIARQRTFARTGSFLNPDEARLFRSLKSLAKSTETGDRAEIPQLPDTAQFWREISAVSEHCTGQSCADYDACWITRMRERALNADLVIVNHHLLCADLAVKGASAGAVIPGYDALILDEAHMLEDVATQYFGARISWLRIDELCRDIGVALRESQRATTEIQKAMLHLRESAQRFFAELEGAAGRRLRPAWMDERLGAAHEEWLARLGDLKAALAALPDRPDAVGACLPRIDAIKREAGFILAADDDDYVFFVEARQRSLAACATPIDVSSLLRERLFAELEAVVLTSATLAVEGRFAYMRTRLGLDAADELLLPSPFDFESQAVLYVPKSMPEPQHADFVARAGEEILRLIEFSRGRAFVLFTSYANMRAVAALLADELEYPLLMQGEAPRALLLEDFKRTPGAVLFATSSFWQGVDVVGEQLSCVIIDKLPFASPGDPVVAARIDRIRQAGGNPFESYQTPYAVLTLKQGLGRLIRSKKDRGVLAVLDSRLIERTYGERFLLSLPPARLVHTLDEVQAFWDSGNRRAASPCET